MKTRKIGKFRIRPSRMHRFSRSTGRIKKNKCKKTRDKEMAKLMEEPAVDAAPFFHPTRAHPNTLPTTLRATLAPLPNTARNIGIAVLFIYMFRSPIQYFCLFALAVLCSLYVSNGKSSIYTVPTKIK